MSRDLRDALDVLEKEKNISKDTLLEAIEQSLIQACKNHFGKADNVHVMIDPETCDFSVYADRTVVEHVEDPALEISLVDAQKTNTNAEIGDVMKVEIQSKEFGRIATQNAKSVILQKIREEERNVIYNQYYAKEKDVVTGIVQRYVGKNISINLGKVDAILLTGGMARDTELCDKLAEYISWIAPIYNYAGSFETEALGFGAIRVLKGDEEAKTYTGKPVWNGFPWDKE